MSLGNVLPRTADAGFNIRLVCVCGERVETYCRVASLRSKKIEKRRKGRLPGATYMKMSWEPANETSEGGEMGKKEECSERSSK